MTAGPFSAGSAHLTISPRLATDFRQNLRTQLKSVNVEHKVSIVPNIAGFQQKLNTAVKSANATVKVGLTPDITGFQAKLNTAVQGVNAPKIKVQADPDLTGFKSKLNAALSGVNAPKIKVRVDPDLAGFQSRLNSLVSGVNAPTIKVKVVPDLDGFNTALNAQLSEAGGKIKIPVELDLTQARAQMLAFRTWAGVPLTLDVDLDTAAAMARIVALRSVMNGIGGINIGGGAAGGLASLGSGAASAGGGMGMLATKIGAIAALVPVALGAVGSLGIGLMGLGAMAGAAGGAVAVGISGIMDAFKAGSAMAESASKDAEAAAEKQSAAARQVEDAQRGLGDAYNNAAQTAKDGNRQIAQAERQVQDAQERTKDAQQDLTRARKDALEQIEDMNLALKGSAISEEDALIAVERARERLANLGKDGDPVTGLDRREAENNLRGALQRVDEVRERNADLRKEAEAANKAGVEGSSQVVAAKKAVADAIQGEKDAQENLGVTQENVARQNAQAQRQIEDALLRVADAQEAQAKAMSETSDAADKYAEALAKLSPSARAFVENMRGMKDVWDAFKGSVQEGLFSGIGSSIEDAGRTILPAITSATSGVASAVGGQIAAIMGTIAGPGLAPLTQALEGTATFITSMTPGIQALVQGFLDMGAAAAQVADIMGAGFGNGLASIGAAFTDLKNSGTLTEVFAGFGQALSGFGNLLYPLIVMLGELGATVGPILGQVFTSLGQIVQSLTGPFNEIANTVGTVLVQVMQSLQPAIGPLADAFASLMTAVAPILPVVAELVSTFVQALSPALSQLFDAMAPIIKQFAVQLQPIIGPLAESFASLFTAVAPLLPPLLDLATTLFKTLAPALTRIFKILAPVIEQMAEELAPIIEQLTPVIAQMAEQIGVALAEALTAIAPSLPMLAESFTEIILALAPFLPQLAEITTNLLPPLMELFNDLVVTFLPPVTAALKWLAEKIIPLVINAVVGLSKQWGEKIELMRTVFNDVKTWLGEAFTDLKGRVTDLVDGIGRVWDGLKKKFADPINWVIDTVFNNGIVKFWNAIASKIGMDQIQPIGLLPDSAGTGGGFDKVKAFARGGTVDGVMSGYSPGRDDRIIAVGGGEAVMRPEWTRAVGKDFVENANAAARSGGVSGARKFMGYFNRGGIVESMEAVVRKHFPMLLTNDRAFSGLRFTDNGYHSKGMAGDFSNGGDAGTPEMKAFANYVADEYQNRTLELIHSPFNRNINNYKDVGDGSGFYGAGTMNQHRNHVHWAVDGPVGEGGAPDPSLWDKIKSGVGGVVSRVSTFFRNLVADQFEKPINALGSIIPNPFPGIGDFGYVPKKMYDTLTGKALDWVRGKAEAKDKAAGSSGSSGAPLGAFGGNSMDYAREIVEAAKERGLPSKAAKIALMTAMAESSLKMWANNSVPESLNYPYDAIGSDHDSVGLFQQRDNGAWGTVEQRMNPRASAGMFYDALMGVDWQSMSPAQAAQAVQRSAFADGSNYAAHEGRADELVAQLYDAGGVIEPNKLAVNLSGKPEAVFTNDEWMLIHELVRLLGMTDFVDKLAASDGPKELSGEQLTGLPSTYGTGEGTVAAGGYTLPTGELSSDLRAFDKLHGNQSSGSGGSKFPAFGSPEHVQQAGAIFQKATSTFAGRAKDAGMQFLSGWIPDELMNPQGLVGGLISAGKELSGWFHENHGTPDLFNDPVGSLGQIAGGFIGGGTPPPMPMVDPGAVQQQVDSLRNNAPAPSGGTTATGDTYHFHVSNVDEAFRRFQIEQAKKAATFIGR